MFDIHREHVFKAFSWKLDMLWTISQRHHIISKRAYQQIPFKNCFIAPLQIIFAKKYHIWILLVRGSYHSHKKRKDSLELFVTEHWTFPKILVPKLPHNASNVNIEGTRKGKQLYYLCGQLPGAIIYLHFIVLILICF